MKKKSTTVKIAFEKENDCNFYDTLKERVHNFLEKANIKPKASTKGHYKTLFFIGLTVLLYLVLIYNSFGKGAFIAFYTCYGFLAAIGMMNISHDALHGSYTSKSRLNRAIGFFGDFFGPSSFFWKKEHTIDHHIFTNIIEHDADLGTTTLLRLCPNSPQRKIHRYQAFYAPFLYCINLLHWVYVSDFKRLIKVYFLKSTKLHKPTPFELTMILFFKCLHVFAFLIVPYKVHTLSFGTVLIGYLSFLAAIGLTLTIIFQLAHIVENVAFPLPSEEGKMTTSFAKHQLATTSNFGMKSKLVRFLFGGLSFQVEHHLFPNLYHGHLHLIAPIVEKTAREYNLPYHSQPSLWKAICSHFVTLYRLGKPLKQPSPLKPMSAKG